MSFDTSRFTFDPWKDYPGVVMEQGRVQLDSDWNEWLAELSRRIQAGTLDILGRAAYPPTHPLCLPLISFIGGNSSLSAPAACTSTACSQKITATPPPEPGTPR